MTQKQQIAIIGSGISGLAAAFLLHPHHDITLYESEDRLGGHSRTIGVRTAHGEVPVDTGFIVYNRRNYPHLTALFEHLQVPVAPSDMSFAVSIDHGWLEYGTQHVSNLFAQKRNLLRPAFWRMIADILRFNSQSQRFLDDGSRLCLGECLSLLGMSDWFRDYYLFAMGGAIWSTPLAKIYDYPAETFLRFFANHGLLSVNGQPQWYTVQGGSREYVRRLSAPYRDRVRLSSPVTRVLRVANGVLVTDGQGERQYDQVVFACHSDQALALLADATPRERDILGAIRYQPNRMVLHSDVSFMPQRRKAWASWVYLSDTPQDGSPVISLSYWMNRLQPLDTSQPMIVTLNPGREPDAALVHDRAVLSHPLFDRAAIDAQEKLPDIQGKNRLWFCGAWTRYGFHEDGLRSAVTVAQALGCEPPWA